MADRTPIGALRPGVSATDRANTSLSVILNGTCINVADDIADSRDAAAESSGTGTSTGGTWTGTDTRATSDDSSPPGPEPVEYVNPLESSSRWYLNARAQAIRYAASLGFGIANRTDPPAPAPSREIELDAVLPGRPGPGKIKVDVWTPPRLATGTRPAVINFHGGGWILGTGSDDARWVGAVMGALDAVVFTPNYRLAPSHPFPIPVEDCVDAVLQIVARAPEFGVDPDRILLSGFSSGATNALATWVVMKDPARFGYTLSRPAPHVVGMVLFYPTMDATMTRDEKRQTCSRPDQTLGKGLTDLFDASYIYPPLSREKRADLRLSPGLMPDELLRHLPPIHLCLCEYDMLLAEAKTFARRLQTHERQVTMRVVMGEKHAWDGPPPMTQKASVHVEYGEAVLAMASWLGQACDTDTESMRSMKTKRPRLHNLRHISFRSKSVS